MKFNLHNITLLIIPIVFSLSACQKDDNSQSQLNLSMSADSTSFATTTTNGVPGNITFTAGFITVNSFQFNAVIEKVPKQNVTNGPLLINLFTVNPNMYIIPLDRGYYTNEQVKVSLIKTATGTAPLTISGKYANSTGIISPIELDLNENTDIILKLKDQLVTDQFTGYTIYMKLYLNKLFTGILASDLDKATKTNGSILITSTLNKTIYTKIKTSLLTSLGGDVSEVDINDN